MIQLSFSNNDPKQILLKERIEDLSLAREIIVDSDLEKAILVHDHQTYTGFEDISKYLDEMEAFMKKWYACRCDMFPE